MWKIFHNKESSVFDSYLLVNDWKDSIFSKFDIKLKKYFAEKVVVYFDNKMLFQQKNGMHENLMESLSLAEKEMQNVGSLFPDIICYWIPEEKNSFLITVNINDYSYYPTGKYGFKVLDNNAEPKNNIEKIRHSSWENLIFSTDISDFSKGWINYTPNLEERTILQAKYILMNNHLKKNSNTLLENIEFEKNIMENHQFKELYDKVLRVMPKIESSLEEEWRTTIVKGLNPSIKINKNKNIK